MIWNYLKIIQYQKQKNHDKWFKTKNKISVFLLWNVFWFEKKNQKLNVFSLIKCQLKRFLILTEKKNLTKIFFLIMIDFEKNVFQIEMKNLIKIAFQTEKIMNSKLNNSTKFVYSKINF